MIVDIYGNPLRVSRTLNTQQTQENARVGMLMKQYAEHPTQGLTPAKLANLLTNAERGDLAATADLAKDMEDKDGHILCELSKRRRAIQGKDWKITPPRNASTLEQRDAQMLSEILEDATWFNDAIFDLTDAILKGFSALELTWSYIEKQQIITCCDFRDQNLFITPPDNFNALRLNDSTAEGIALNQFGWATHVHKSKSGYVHRAGLTTVLAWPFLFKNYSIRDLAEFLEIYGLPLRLGKYHSGANDDEKATLLRAVLSIGHNAGGIIPKGMDIEFQNAANGQSDPFEAMIKWCETTQSKAVLGATLTSQADGKTSTNALGNVHLDVLKDITESDVRQLEQTITRDILYPMFALNGKSYRGNRRIPRFEFDTTEAEDIAQLAPALKTLVEAGAKVPLSWVNDKLQIPEPKKGEPILVLADSGITTPGTTAPGTTTPGTTAPAAALNAVPNTTSPQKTLDEALNKLAAGENEAQYHRVLQPLFNELEKGDLDSAFTKLSTLYPENSTDELTELFARVIFVGELWGYVNA